MWIVANCLHKFWTSHFSKWYWVGKTWNGFENTLESQFNFDFDIRSTWVGLNSVNIDAIGLVKLSIILF